MKLYPQSEKEFSDSVFQDPPAEYRGTPFWSWNTKLEKGRLKEQIGVFEEMISDSVLIMRRKKGCVAGCMTRTSGRQAMEAAG